MPSPTAGRAGSLRKALLEEMEERSATSFTYEEDSPYTSRESQLIQRYLAEQGSMLGADQLDDWF